MKPPPRTVTPAQHLIRRGHQMLAEGNFERALDISTNLRHLRSAGTYEIGAMALAGLDRLPEAIDLLEEGVSIAPDVWLLWQLLGNYRSNLGFYEEAAEAYEQALRSPHVWKESVRLNQAILSNRRGDPAAALEYLRELDQSILKLGAVPVQMAALAELGRIDDAVEAGERALKETAAQEDTAQALAGIAAQVGRLRLKRGEAAAEVRRFALDWAGRAAPAPELLALIRDLDPQTSPSAQYYRLLVDAVVPPDAELPEPAKGYYRVVDAVADSQAEALDLLLALELEIPGADFTLDEVEVLEPRPDDPKGVYRVSHRAYYRRER